MKSDFMLAITQLSAEKNLPKEIVLRAVEAALVSAYRKDNFAPNQNIAVKINPNTGKVEVWVEKTVVETLTDSRREILFTEARRIKPDVELGQGVLIEATPANAGRIAAQTAKQVILQRLHEAEHSAIFEEYAGKEGDIVIGIIQHLEPKQIFIDLGRTEAVLPVTEQVRTEKYRIGQRLKVYLIEIARTPKGPRVIVSRSHPNLAKRLFELEVPEVLSGAVEIKSISREAGYRSKVAVAAKQEGIDPVGCCVGLRGIRIQNIVNELNGEKLDVVQWHPDPAVFIANSLSPAKVMSVRLDTKEGIATVVVPDRQLSLAIGKEGQNARLAAKLTGWRIDIKSMSVAEAEKAAEPKPVEVEVEAAPEIVVIAPVTQAPVVTEVEPEKVLVEAEAAFDLPEVVSEPEREPQPEISTTLIMPTLHPVGAQKRTIRFAEEILAPSAAKVTKSKDKKKKRSGKEREEDGARGKKRGFERDIPVEDEDMLQ